MGSITTKSPLGNIPEAFLGLLKAQAQWGQEYFEAVTGTKLPPASDPVNALKQALPKPVCHVPPPCWMPRPLGEVVSYVDNCGKACLRLVITNCDRIARTVTARAEPAGPDANKAPISVEPSALSLGPMERGRVQLCMDLPEGTESGTSYESLVWVDGCRQHYLRWTVLVGSGGLDSTYEVQVKIARTTVTTGTITSTVRDPVHPPVGATRLAEKTPFEEVVRKAYDANVRYWETVGRAATDYMQTVSKLWAEAPLTWTPGAFTSAKQSSECDDPQESTAALVLEGRAGNEVRAVVMLTNELGKDLEAAVVASALVGPTGESVGLKIRTDPEIVKLAPGSRVPVTLIVDLSDKLVPGTEYRGEVNVPGLSPRGMPVVVRRVE